MASVREEAQALRAGLIGNVVNISEVVSWADARIAEGQGRNFWISHSFEPATSLEQSPCSEPCRENGTPARRDVTSPGWFTVGC